MRLRKKKRLTQRTREEILVWIVVAQGGVIGFSMYFPRVYLLVKTLELGDDRVQVYLHLLAFLNSFVMVVVGDVG